MYNKAIVAAIGGVVMFLTGALVDPATPGHEQAQDVWLAVEALVTAVGVYVARNRPAVGVYVARNRPADRL